MEALPFDQYTVKMDGSGRLTTRNRKFLRAYTPASVTTLPPLMVTDETPRLATPAQEAIRDDRATDISIDECPQFEEVGKLQDPATSPTTGLGTRRMPCASSRNPAASPTTAPGTRRVPRALSRLHDFNAPGRKEGARNLRRR